MAIAWRSFIMQLSREEKSKGSAKILLDRYIEKGNLLIKNNKTSKVFD
jgi:hypothetical protein